MFLTLSYLFDELKLVRVQYDANVSNEASIRAAERFGFRAEGICRNYNGLPKLRVAAHDAAGEKREDEVVSRQILNDNGQKDTGGHQAGPAAMAQGHDTWLSSMTDYEWVNGGKKRLQKLMERPVVDIGKND
ncbi:hypothetical protein I317_07591 [Kwoniella heveanensis CBS 569]|nr:hypothetical protein I317_07591 [Kwoniella heveanensis CBS 569]